MTNGLKAINLRKVRLSPGRVMLYVVFAWFILACLILPNLNLLQKVFFTDGGFSLEPVQKLLRSSRAMKALRNSFILGPCLSLTVGFVGITLVLITEYFDIKGARVLRLGYMTTLIYGGIILVSGYKFIYGHNGYLTNLLIQLFPGMSSRWFTGFWAVLFVMTFACTSNHMIFLRNAMRAVDFQTVEAARNLGAGQFTILWRVVLPVLRPSLFAVTILTFITGLSAMSAPMLVGGTEFQTINPMIRTFANTQSSQDLAALLSLVLGLATMLLLFFMTRIEKKGHYMSVSKVKTRIIKQKITNPVLNVLAHVYAYVLFVIYTLPVLLVILFSFSNTHSISMRTLDLSSLSLDNYRMLLQNASSYRPFLVSMAYSAVAAICVGVMVVTVCRLIQKRRNTLTSAALEYSMMIPWLLPTTLIALGLVLTFNVQRWYMFNQVLTGTMIILLLGYVIIKLPFTMRMTKAAFFSLDDALEDAAKNLGAGEIYTFIRVILPVILPTVLAIAALNFNSLLGDYDMSVFLYHPINPTLGVTIKSLTDDTTDINGTAMTFVYAVLMMIISALVLYLVYGRGSNENIKE